MDLRIKTVYRQDFRNFTFVVENTQGMHEMEVVLIPEGNTAFSILLGTFDVSENYYHNRTDRINWHVREN